jgi:transcriptional regulator with XRE-family HTH domain
VRSPALAGRLRPLVKEPRRIRELARKSGIDKGTISGWAKERDEGEDLPAVKVEAVARLAKVLGVEVDWLLDLPTAAPGPEASLVADLLGRVASLSHEAEELELPAQKLDQDLKVRLGNVSRLTSLLAELRRLDADARALPPDPPSRS